MEENSSILPILRDRFKAILFNLSHLILCGTCLSRFRKPHRSYLYSRTPTNALINRQERKKIAPHRTHRLKTATFRLIRPLAGRWGWVLGGGETIRGSEMYVYVKFDNGNMPEIVICWQSWDGCVRSILTRSGAGRSGVARKQALATNSRSSSSSSSS